MRPKKNRSVILSLKVLCKLKGYSLLWRLLCPNQIQDFEAERWKDKCEELLLQTLFREGIGEGITNRKKRSLSIKFNRGLW